MINREGEQIHLKIDDVLRMMMVTGSGAVEYIFWGIIAPDLRAKSV